MTSAPEFAFNLFDPAVKADPYPHYAEMRRAGRVIANPFLGGQFMVSGYDDVLALLSDPTTFGSTIGGVGAGAPSNILAAPTMLTSDPPDHERLRATVARAFTPRSVSALEPRMQAVAVELVAPLGDGGMLDVVADLGEKLPVLVIAEMLGVGTADLADFVTWSHGLMGVLDMFAPPAKAEYARECSKHLHDYFAVEVARRRDGGEDGEDDLVGRLVAANEDGRLTENELLAACVLLLLGGNETTTKLITNAVLALGRNPGERARITADPALLTTAVDEALRFDTPVQANGRVARIDTEFAGVHIPKGSMVVGVLGAANRDPSRFGDPDRFDAGRDPNPHLSFSRGIHHCLGASLARLEARAALAALLDVAPNYDFADDPAALEYGPTFFFHAPTRLRITAP
jgi:cytochrome P450